MAGHSVPVDFWVDKERISNSVERKTLIQDLLPIIQPFAGNLKEATADCVLSNGHHFTLLASDDTTVSVKMYKEGLISATIEYFTEAESVNKHRIHIDDGRKMEKDILSNLKATRARVLPAIKRAPPVNPFFTTADDRILEYDVDSLLFDETSQYQKVQIYKTKSFGNMLVLDGLQNLAESDISEYTEALMHLPHENYKGKDVLILGGGDGSLLQEILKQNPAFVTMIDIDETVLRASKKHLRSVCGDLMDNYDGKNYKIIIGDAIEYMKDYGKEGKKFDYVFGDLTDVPLSDNPHGELWQFFRLIMNLAVSLLKPKGKYLTHTISVQMKSALEMFEKQTEQLNIPVTFTKSESYVPSFMEKWCFYQISLKNSS